MQVSFGGLSQRLIQTKAPARPAKRAETRTMRPQRWRRRVGATAGADSVRQRGPTGRFRALVSSGLQPFRPEDSERDMRTLQRNSQGRAKRHYSNGLFRPSGRYFGAVV